MLEEMFLLPGRMFALRVTSPTGLSEALVLELDVFINFPMEPERTQYFISFTKAFLTLRD